MVGPTAASGGLLKTWVIDLGADTIKAVASATDDPRILPNVLIQGRDQRWRWPSDAVHGVGDRGSCSNHDALRQASWAHPFDGGLLTRWQTQQTILDHAFDTWGVDPAATDLVVTEPVLNPAPLQHVYDEILYERYGFARVARVPAAALAFAAAAADVVSGGAVPDPNPCALLIDLGHTSTTVVPIIAGRIVRHAVRRLPVAGRVLTNALNDLLSLRHVHLLDDAPAARALKEQVCFVAGDYATAMRRARREHAALRAADIAWTDAVFPSAAAAPTVLADYILPDGITHPRGALRSWHGPSRTPRASQLTAVRDSAAASGTATAAPTSTPAPQHVLLGTERFHVPERLFTPPEHTDGVGLVAAIRAAVAAVAAASPLAPLLYAHIHLCGGTAALPGLARRLARALQADLVDGTRVHITTRPAPALDAVLGGATWVRAGRADGADGAPFLPTPLPPHAEIAVSRAEYLEHGPQRCGQRGNALYHAA